MKSNLGLSGGLISAEAVMMTLGTTIGRQEAHAVVHHAAHAVASGVTSRRCCLPIHGSMYT